MDLNWFLKGYMIERLVVKGGELVLYYLKYGLGCGFVREELMIVLMGFS